MTTFNSNIQRIGFACKIQKSHDVAEADLNTKSTTISWLSKQTKATTINVSSTKNVLNALRDAARHLGLTDYRLLQKNEAGSDLTVS